MGKRKKAFEESLQLNQKTYDYWMRRLTELAVNTIEWTDLPDTIDTRYLEMILCNKGLAVFFKDQELDQYLALNVMISDKWNVYNIPTGREAYAVNGYHNKLDISNSVIIFNNYLHTPTIIDLEIYARKLYEVDRAIDVNIIGQKTPHIVKCSENQRLVLENLFMNYQGNIPFIFGDKSMNFENLDTIDITTPYVTDKLQIARRQIFNDALTYLGIENNSNEKAERMVTNESLSNLGAIEAARKTRLNARQQACALINKMFGLNVSVKYRVPLTTEIARAEIEMENPEKEVKENGTLYNGS